MTALVCACCRREFVPSHYKRTKYCSDGCKNKHWRQQNPETMRAHRAKEVRPPRCHVTFAYCPDCGRAYRKGGSRCVLCTDARRKARARVYSEQRERANAKTRPSCTCEVCGVKWSPVYPHKGRAFCSRECQRKDERRRGHGGSARSRAKARGAKRQAVSWGKVGNRDGWKCSGCGEETPRWLRGKNVANSPELDHIVALSAGGPHTYDNVWMLCRRCNQEKSDMDVLDWLSLLRYKAVTG